MLLEDIVSSDVGVLRKREEGNALARLELQGYPISRDGHNLSDSWGGYQLHIVELVE
jgi:hypothetical protein